MMSVASSLTDWRARRRVSRIMLLRSGMPVLLAHDAWTFASRLRGLHGVPPLGQDDALILRPCSAIQTFGMKESLDVLFLDKTGVIVRIDTVKPRRIAWCQAAHQVVEMSSGTVKRHEFSIGQRLISSARPAP